MNCIHLQIIHLIKCVSHSVLLVVQYYKLKQQVKSAEIFYLFSNYLIALPITSTCKRGNTVYPRVYVKRDPALTHISLGIKCKSLNSNAFSEGLPPCMNLCLGENAECVLTAQKFVSIFNTELCAWLLLSIDPNKSHGVNKASNAIPALIKNYGLLMCLHTFFLFSSRQA